MQAGENKNTLIYRAYSAVIIDGLRGDGDESIKEVIKKGAMLLFDSNRLVQALVSEHVWSGQVA